MKTFTLTVIPKNSTKLDSKKKKVKKLKKKSKLLSENDKNPVESAKAVKLSDSSKQPVIEPPAPETVPEPAKIKHVDLHPWPFETQKSGKIRRREWNTLVRSIVDAHQSDCDADCDAAHKELHRVYEENKNLKEKYGNLLDFMRKHFREFEATYL